MFKETIIKNGITHEFNGRFNKRKDAEDVARVWKGKGYKSFVIKSEHPYTGYMVYVGL